MKVTKKIIENKIVGLEGGKDSTWFKVLSIKGDGNTSYYPAIDPDTGRVLSLYDDLQGDIDRYLELKQPRERYTIEVVIAGNPIKAEAEMQKILGCLCMSTTPNTVDVYPDFPPIPEHPA